MLWGQVGTQIISAFMTCLESCRDTIMGKTYPVEWYRSHLSHWSQGRLIHAHPTCSVEPEMMQLWSQCTHNVHRDRSSHYQGALQPAWLHSSAKPMHPSEAPPVLLSLLADPGSRLAITAASLSPELFCLWCSFHCGRDNTLLPSWSIPAGTQHALNAIWLVRIPKCITSCSTIQGIYPVSLRLLEVCWPSVMLKVPLLQD